MARKITNLRIADRNYVVGEKGVKAISETLASGIPLFNVSYDNGRMITFFAPQTLVELWSMEGPDIVIPEIVLPDGATKAE